MDEELVRTASGRVTEVEEHVESCPRSRERRRRALGLVVLASAASLLGTGAFASWQASAAASSASLQAATAAISVVGAPGGQLAVAVNNLVPDDFLYRYVDVTNNGTVAGTFTGSLSAPGTLGSGLVVAAESCPTSWNTTAATCAGAAAGTPLGSGTLSSPVPVTHGTLAPGAVQHVRYRIAVASAAPTSLMGTASTVAISVTSDLVGNRDRTTG